MEDMIFLYELLESNDDSEKQKGNELKNRIKELAEKYKNVKGEIEFNENIPIESRGSEVYGFYVYQEWVYLLDDSGNDIDPMNVETEFLEKFTNYASDEGNINIQ